MVLHKRSMLRRSDVLALGALLAAGAASAGGSPLAARARGATSNAGGKAGSASAVEATTGARALGFDQPASVASGPAFIRYDPAGRSWTLGNDFFEERLELQPAPNLDPAVAANGPFRLARRSLFARDRNIV